MIQIFDKQKIIDYLKAQDEILNLNIIGAIENISPEKFGSETAGLEIYVDDPESPNGVVVREHGYWHYCYGENDDFIYLAKAEIFDHYDAYGIDASHQRVFEILKEGRTLEWEEPCKLLYLKPEDFKPVDNRLNLADGTTDLAEIINEHYTFKDESSLYFIEESLRNRPSSVYYADGEPVAWVLVHRDDSMGIMYTKDAYRGKGIAYDLSMNLLNKLIVCGKTPFIHIGLENTASFKLAEKCGFKPYETIYWFGIKN